MREDVHKYRPCNGTEGAIFDAEWCARCKYDARYRETQEGGCRILAHALCYGIDDPKYPVEWIDDGDGPRCTAFAPIDDGEDDPPLIGPPIPDSEGQALLPLGTAAPRRATVTA